MSNQLYDKVALNTGLVLDLPFREGVAAVACDVSKTHAGGVDNAAAPTWTQLASGIWSRTFNGTTQYFVVTTGVLNGVDAYSTATWFKTAAGGGGVDGRRVLFESKAAGNAYALSQCVVGTTNKFRSGALLTDAGFVTVDSVTTIVDGTWYLGVATFERNSFHKVYLQGAYENQGAVTDAATETFTSINFGTYRTADNRWFSGQIGRIRMWSRALSALEIAALFASEKGLHGL